MPSCVFLNDSVPTIRVYDGHLAPALVPVDPEWVSCTPCSSSGGSKLCLHTADGKAFCPLKMRPKCLGCQAAFDGHGKGKICIHYVDYETFRRYDMWFANLACDEAKAVRERVAETREALGEVLMEAFGIKYE